MRKRIQIKSLYNLLPILGLVILLLLSPCKVRNFIQSELGIPQTEALNKSQSTISQSNCLTFEFAKVTQTTSKLVFQQSDFPILGIFNFDFFDTQEKYSFLKPLEYQPISDIPLYILYQNILIYF